MNIPGFLQLLKEDRIDDAFELVVMDNPLPASTGRVCQHPCELRCRRAGADAAVNMRETHRYIGDMMYDNGGAKQVLQRILKRKKRRHRQKNRRGRRRSGGPERGVLSRVARPQGHRVRQGAPDAGGMLRYALPEYRLPKKIVDKEIAFIRGAGVQFKFNAELGKTLTLDKLAQEQRRRLPGASAPGRNRRSAFPATTPKVCCTRRWRSSTPRRSARNRPSAKKVAVIGGGNSAIDAARTAMRQGAEVTIVYRRSREDMPAIPDETEQALEEGVQAHHHGRAVARHHRQRPASITGLEVAKTVPGKYDARGRRAPVVTKDTYVIPCDTIIKAIGEKPDSTVDARRSVWRRPRGASVKVDPWTLQTSNPKVYAGGDYVTGAANVSTAMGAGKKAAKQIDRQLTGAGSLRGILAEVRVRPHHPARLARRPAQSGAADPGRGTPRQRRSVAHLHRMAGQGGMLPLPALRHQDSGPRPRPTELTQP